MSDNKNKTVGAWLVHHANKLSSVTSTGRLDNVTFAGKSVILLSALAESDQGSTINKEKLEAVASSCGINRKTELPTLLSALKDEKLIDIGTSGGCSVLGVTTGTALEHGATIFNRGNPSPDEVACIEIAEKTSLAPMRKDEAKAFLNDTCQIEMNSCDDFLNMVSEVGLIDREGEKLSDQVFFNGNIFRRDCAAKAALILGSLPPNEQIKVREVESAIAKSGCVEIESVKNILGVSLWGKLHAIGYFDQLTVENDTESIVYVTMPSSFSKYGNSLIDDALDLSKALTASLTYGINRSAQSRGRINSPEALMRRLLSGDWVGPATAIGQDYHILEMKRVVEIKPDWGSTYKMRLRKREVGEIALAAITSGAASLTSLTLTGASVSRFVGPEENRYAARKRQMTRSKRETKDILEALRTGM